MRKQIISLFLVVHGLIHFMFQFEIIHPDTGEHVGWNGVSWLLITVIDNQVVLLIGIVIWVLAVILFNLTGIVLLMEKRIWRELDIVASVVSLTEFILFCEDKFHTSHNF